jgi:galactonate dehydratase
MSDLTITALELFPVAPRWLFLKISTAGGISGWGEPVVEGKAATVRAAVEEMSGFVVGRQAGDIEDIWQTLYRGGFYRGGPVLMSAMAGIDQALWDIKGKALGVPIYELLGGAVRERMKIYGWIGGDKPENVADGALKRKEEGYLAVKMNGTSEMEWIATPAEVDSCVARLAAVREAVGQDFGIGVDFHGRVHKAMARILAREMEPYNPMFIEEPVLTENNDALLSLRQTTAIPIATGERMYSRWDFKPILENGSVDIIQPDLSHAGGISECRRIAAMAEAYDVAIAPHCPLGPIAFAACLQLDFASPNALIQETSLGIHYNQGTELSDYLVDPNVFAFDQGYVSRPTGAGLGIEVNEDNVRAAAETGHDWKNPVWRNPDGSVTEW